MALNFSTLVYLPSFDVFARDIYITPVVSQPAVPAYYARGILDTRGTVINTDVGMAVVSDQETILDIREIEFTVLPVQGDRVNIPVDSESGIPAAGDYEITDAASNGGGETTLIIRKIVTPAANFYDPD